MSDSLKEHFKVLHRRGVLFSALVAVFFIAIAWFWQTAVIPYREHFTLYFSSDVHGLSVGAPVTINGQTVGQVKKIELASILDEKDQEKFFAAVSITLDTRTLSTSGYLYGGQTFEDALPQFIDIGLRGRLLMPSMLADGLCVELYFAKKQPALKINLPNAKYPEIPTNYISSSQHIDNANTFIETRKLYEVADKIRALRGIILKLDTATMAFDGAAVNAKTLAVLERANAVLSPELIHHELSSLNLHLDSLCRELEQGKELSQERQEEIRHALKTFSAALFEVRQSAQALKMQLEPENIETRQRLLKEIQKQFEPLIELGRTLLF